MSKKVLVVDDSSTVRQLIRAALVPAGFVVLEATDGVDGTEKVRGDCEIALILCDVNMPRMNGLEMVEAIRDLPNAAGVPIVMLTTEGDPALIARARQAGAKGWIVKPFNADILVAAARKLAA